MRILVCAKAVPTTAQVQVDGQFRLQRDSTTLQWNIADESALEAALRLRGSDGCVCVLSMGPGSLEPLLRELLARGADRAVLLTDPAMAGADTQATAAALAAAARQLGPFDLILCGRRAMDGETGQIPGMLAAELDLPCITNAEAILAKGEGMQVTRRLEAGTAELTLSLPALVSLCEYTYPLRLAGILGLRRARQLPVEHLSAQDLGLAPTQCGLQGSLTAVVSMTTHFPGLRNGPREPDPIVGAKRLLQLCREVVK